MGHCQSCLSSRSSPAYCHRRRPIFVLFIGLDNSGKTSIVKWYTTTAAATESRMRRRHQRQQISDSDFDASVACNDVAVVVPTVGLSVSRIAMVDGRCPVIAFDLSGQARYRNLWSYYYRQCSAIAFVVDSADNRQLAVSRALLADVLSHRYLVCRRTRVPVLLLANKSDKQEAVRDHFRLCNSLGLVDEVFSGAWHLVSCSAQSGAGLRNGLYWLIAEVMRCRYDPEQRESSNFVSWLTP